MLKNEPLFITPKLCLSELSGAGLILSVEPKGDLEISGISGRVLTDSRKVEKGDIFIAYEGVNQDSHKFIQSILTKSPGLIIYDKPEFAPPAGTCQALRVRNSREAWSWICAAGNGHPQKHLKFLGVTGTNGKTSICWILQKLMEHEGHSVLNIGTLGFIFNGAQILSNKHTTPDPPEFYRALREAIDRGARWVVMECSSHSLSQKKLAPVIFEACAWSSFSRDHLDYHKTMENYFKAKWQLFTKHLNDQGLAILSDSLHPEPDLRDLEPTVKVSKISTRQDSRTQETTLHPLRVETARQSPGSLHLRLKHQSTSYEGSVPLFGDYNLENFMIACLMFEKAIGHFPQPGHWSAITPVPGRMEFIHSESPEGPSVCVDFAHTPDALDKCLITLKAVTKGKLWVVFGCGGDRDSGKRPEMATVAETHADHIIITSDNPRFEDPDQIIAEIKKGLQHPSGCQTEPDRDKAIALAINSAEPLDTILIAGKGHESVQTIRGVSTPFDDRIVALTHLTKSPKGS